MGINGHNDTFTLNDITFSVPPTQITVERDAVNYNWQTLRTNNSQTVKSGKGVVSIRFTAVFVGLEDINSQLRPLIAQLVLTPICFAENQYLRESLSLDSEASLALILKSLSLSVQPELKDAVVAHFDFAWFNYKPYLPELRFKRDVLDNSPESFPADSLAWQKFYRAELGDLAGNSSRYGRLQGKLNDTLVFSWNELFVDRKDLTSKDAKIKRTDIVYETTNERENGLRLFTAANELSCGESSGLIVTGLTILYENIVAALPVIGHHYMTYQHIGSIDPRLILNIAATSDGSKAEVVRMWNMVEKNALKFRHVPQEFMALSVQNDLVNLAGLRRFVTEALSEETIPGQPGTYSLNLRLKAVEYERTKEKLSSEFVTTEQVRNEILKTLNSMVQYEDVDLGRVKKKAVPTIKDTPENALLRKTLQSYCDIINEATQAFTFSLLEGLTVLGSAPRSRKLLSILQDSENNELKDMFLPLRETVLPSLRSQAAIGSGFFTPGLATSDTLLDQVEKTERSLGGKILDKALAIHGAVDKMLLNIGTEKAVRQTLESFKDETSDFSEILQYLSRVTPVLDNIIIDGTIDLPEFDKASELAQKMGVFRGSTAYPDFPALAVVAAGEKMDALQLDPSFYFYSPALDGLTNLIDPGMMQAAETAAKTLYTEQGGAGNRLGDWVNSLKRFVEDNYVNRFEPKTSASNSLKSGLQLQKMWAAKGMAKVQNSSFRETDPKYKFNNALSTGRALSSYKESKDNALNSVPDPATETVIKSLESLTHDANLESIFSKDPAQYSLPEIQAMGMFMRPVPGITTSPFGPRDVKENPEASKLHKGIDLRASTGTPVVASASGTVIRTGLQDPANDKVGYGNRVWIRHKNGYATVYAHLSSIVVRERQRVRAGDVIGYSGGDVTDYGAGNSKQAHLHFEIRDEAGNPLDPEKVLNGSIIARDTSSGEGARFGTSLLARSVESLQDSLLNGQGPSMARAYPTFKLYFMEEDQEDRIFGFDDFFSYHAVKSIRVVRSRKVPADLCVIELTNVSGILSNRKFANEFNKSGEFTGNKPRGFDDKILEENSRAAASSRNTASENPIASLMLQEGTRINLRLGYSSDPDKLEDVFVGQIVEVEFNHTDDLVTIVCQSYATELVQMVKGLDKADNRGGWFLGTNKAATGRLLSDLLQEPEVLHFGRWQRSRANGVIAGLLARDRGTNTNLDLLTNRYEWKPRPQDDNIFPPVLRGDTFESYFAVQNLSDNERVSAANFLIDSIGLPPAFQFNFLTYNISKSTIWDVFKEMELRHPGCIASPVPYRDARQGPRMTMFFGLPNQLYFARDPKPQENRRNETIVNTVRENQDKLSSTLEKMADLYGVRRDTASERLKLSLQSQLETLAIFTPVVGGLFIPSALAKSNPHRFVKNEQRGAYEQHIRKQLALKDKSIRPFRSYHILTSNNHIIENNIRASSLDVFNSVAIEYTDESFMKKIARKVLNLGPGSAGDSVFPQNGIFRLKADAGIPDEEVREAFIQYPNCVGSHMAEFYALGALKNLLRDIYKGEIVTIGNPGIKPYDVCYVFDEYTDMIGPVEVEQVVHYFSQETGFVTEITPDICVSINEWTTMGTMDAVGLVVESLISTVFKRPLKKISKPSDMKTRTPVGEIALGVTLPVMVLPAGVTSTLVAGGSLLGLTGAFMASKMVHWSKFRHPVAISPLLYKGKPLMAAMGSKTIDANWATDLGKWFKNGFEGARLFLEDIGDSLVFAGSNGKLGNVGVNSVPPSYGQ